MARGPVEHSPLPVRRFTFEEVAGSGLSGESAGLICWPLVDDQGLAEGSGLSGESATTICLPKVVGTWLELL